MKLREAKYVLECMLKQPQINNLNHNQREAIQIGLEQIDITIDNQ